MNKPFESGKPLVVIIDLLEARNEKLLKNVPTDYLNGTFRDLFDYMVDPEPDDFNKGYTIDEKKSAGVLTDWVSQYNAYSSGGDTSNKINMAIMAQKDGKLDRAHVYRLDDTVGDNVDLLVSVKENKNDDGTVTPYKEMYLFTQLDVKGA